MKYTIALVVFDTMLRSSKKLTKLKGLKIQFVKSNCGNKENGQTNSPLEVRGGTFDTSDEKKLRL